MLTACLSGLGLTSFRSHFYRAALCCNQQSLLNSFLVLSTLRTEKLFKVNRAKLFGHLKLFKASAWSVCICIAVQRCKDPCPKHSFRFGPTQSSYHLSLLPFLALRSPFCAYPSIKRAAVYVLFLVPYRCSKRAVSFGLWCFE